MHVDFNKVYAYNAGSAFGTLFHLIVHRRQASAILVKVDRLVVHWH